MWLQKLVVKKLTTRKILDSRGNPTIEVDVVVGNGKIVGTGRAAAPSGASTGKHEVVAFPEGGPDASIDILKRSVAPKLVGMAAEKQRDIDSLLHELDGTFNFSKIGGNAAVATSMAVAKATAAALGIPLYRYLGGDDACSLPYPIGNVLGGGAHAGRMAPDIQEFISVGIGAERVIGAVFANAKVHKKVKAEIEKRDKTFTGGKGDEGAWAPNLDSLQAMEVVSEACKQVGQELGFEVRPAIDIAASSLYDEEKKKYIYQREGKAREGGEQIDFVVDLVKNYKLFYVEDPLHEEDFEGFAELTRKVGKDCLICGDDIFVTNVERIERGMKTGSANAVLIKPNQIGTLSDTAAAVRITKEHNCVPTISHRSGETPDETIAHLAVAWRCPLIKTGAVGGERIAKLNELIRIEEELGSKAKMGRL
ncbi:MAG TPA: phosphopyruvate hydratase [Hadesarchaea archaeon]|nr:phosphopyruvate hydratase [Hadesarchaea archaeon]